MPPFWSHQFREWRHNPCIMTPISILLILALSIGGILLVATKLPLLLLALVFQPLLNRFAWVIEFIYPTPLGRSLHLLIIRLVDRTRKSRPNDKNYGYHSRAMETRIEIVKDRVYVHPLPQLLDNLGYLVVCCPPPPPPASSSPLHVGVGPFGGAGSNTDRITVSQKQQPQDDTIVAFVVDVGDAKAVVRQIKLISKRHYHQKKIQLQSILSTHKHHDHTAGNQALFHHDELGADIKLVFGGAVEKVPMCNFILANGDKLPLPKQAHNRMNDLMEVEAVATPGHTRGSLTYVLRPLLHDAPEESSISAILFTGDTMFSGGGGVPFEADLDPHQDSHSSRMTADAYIKASAAKHAVDRNFSELLFRSIPHGNMPHVTSDRILVLPGHEYTHDLLNRQLSQPLENCKWKNFSPAIFFETVSQYYVSLHRRSLPHSSGRLLCAPSSVAREVLINPNLRGLYKRGEVLVSAIRQWNLTFAKTRVGDTIRGGAYGLSGVDCGGSKGPLKTGATEKQWTLDARDINAPVFTTVYAADLDQVIDDLDQNKIDTKTAATQLREIKTMLSITTVGRRPIPGTLPSERVVYKGLVGFALLGSAPTALTHSDSIAMNLPPPIDTSSDLIRVSKKKLVAVLYWLGLLSEENAGQRTVAMIDNLWKEACEYEARLKKIPIKESSAKTEPEYDAVDVETSSLHNDTVELGSLKWILYGIPTQQPSYFPSFCMPCSKPTSVVSEKHPIQDCNLKREYGELVRHNVFECLLCKGATGCPDADREGETVGCGSFVTNADSEGEDGIEIDRNTLGAILRDV